MSRRTHPQPRRGFTLIEMVIATLITSLIMGAVVSTIALSARALPQNSLRETRQMGVRSALNELVADLESAISVVERGGAAIAFTVADRDADGKPERIRYSWSGTTGDPLLRSYNGGAAEPVLTDLSALRFSYETEVTTETHMGVGIEDLASSLLMDTSGISATNQNWRIKANDWVGQHLTPTLPGDAIGWRPTSVDYRGRLNGLLSSANATLQIRGISPTMSPSGAVLASRNLPPSDLLAMTYLWRTMPISTIGVLSSTDTLSFSARYASGSEHIELEFGDSNGSGRQSTTNAGSSWSYSGSRFLRMRLYGKITRRGPDRSWEREFIRGITIHARTTDPTAPLISTRAALLNTPQVLNTRWDTDFSKDPTTLDQDRDETADFAVRSGSFQTATLSAGIWRIDRALITNPENAMLGRICVETSIRGVTSGSEAILEINPDWTGGARGGLILTIRNDGDGTQTAQLNARTGPASTEPLATVVGLPTGFIDVRLLVSPTDDVVNLRIAGTDRGSFRYTPYAAGTSEKWIGLRATGSAEADFLRVRVHEVLP